MCAWGRQSCVCEAVKQVGKCGHGEGRVVYVKQSNREVCKRKAELCM